MTVYIQGRARRQIERISRWWLEHRPASGSLFVDELTSATRLLIINPRSGAHYTDARNGEVRRFLLERTHYHVYFRIEKTRITVLAVWGAARERTPKL